MKLITERFVWPNINRAVRDWSRAYLQRQRAETHLHTNALLGKFLDHTPGSIMCTLIWLVPCSLHMVISTYSR
ncbi:hypothetical protein, partial [Streptococcus dysgalactiae]|uniref:hypothetical protein n=1 Tax=Streptococcus dysgalactiae TaxID=1334 RepID=UPI002469A3D3